MQEIDEILRARLKEMLEQCHISENRFADSVGCTRSQLNNLKNGRTSFRRLGLDVACRLFPEIERVVISGIGNVHQEANGNTNSHITQSAAGKDMEDRSEALRAKIVLDLIDLDLSPEIQSKVLKVVKNAKLETV